MTEFRVPTDQGDMLVNLDKVPTDLKARQEALAGELKAGRWRPAPPSMVDTTLGAARAVGSTVAPLVLPALAIGRGMVAGAPLGPLGVLGGAALGGMTGFAGNEAVDLGRRVLTGEAPRPTGDVIRDTLIGGGRAGLESTPPGLVASGGFDLVSGSPGAGLMKLGLAAVPGAARFLASNEPAILAATREATNKAARAFGVELTAAQQAGKPMLKAAEAFLSRSAGGSGQFQSLGARQNQQIIAAAQDVGERLTGAPLDQATRNNRFLMALEGRVEDVKQQASQAFTDYVTIAGSASPVTLTHTLPSALALMPDATGKLRTTIQKLVDLSRNTGLNTSALTPQPQAVPLTVLRDVRTRLGEIAYPSPLAGVVNTDTSVRDARRLYGALTADLEAHATAQGPQVAAKLAEANQFNTLTVHGLDGKFYAGVLSSEKRLGQFSSQLFNPRDTGMLMDAKTATTPEGFQLIQQQYWDDVLSPAAKGAIKTTDEGPMFLGKQFADRITRDQNVLRVLFDADGVKAINDLAAVARTADSTMSVTRQRAFTSGLMGFFQASAAGSAATSMVLQGPGVGNVTALAANTVGPFLLGHAFTNPTTAKMIAAAAKNGSLSAETGEAVGRYLLRFTAIGRNQSVNVPVPEGLQR